MGQVWRARDTVLHRPVAVKVLRSEFTGDPTFVARFRAEAQHTAVLAHRNIATLYDYGEAPAGEGGEHLAYLVMELVEGEPLSALLAREGRLDAPRGTRPMAAVGSASPAGDRRRPGVGILVPVAALLAGAGIAVAGMAGPPGRAPPAPGAPAPPRPPRPPRGARPPPPPPRGAGGGAP